MLKMAVHHRDMISGSSSTQHSIVQIRSHFQQVFSNMYNLSREKPQILLYLDI